ncbi:hypothetical protein [Streptomyces uncialis]|uniref:hypothetical protein n=1 Tax=Streptomyces uncialis TaxID=1048205 RepID=UPI0033F54751
MIDTDEPQTAVEQDGNEHGGGSERTAKFVLGGVGLLAAWGVVAAAPETAYFAAGLLTCRGCHLARDWLTRRRTNGSADSETDDDSADITAALHTLADGGRHVLLTELRDATTAPDTRTVRALLDAAGIPVRAGVRTPHGNGPGVHHDDIPPRPTPDDDTPPRCCSCTSEANTNTYNSHGGEGRKGFRVEAIGLAGAVVHHPAEATRHHTVQQP